MILATELGVSLTLLIYSFLHNKPLIPRFCKLTVQLQYRPLPRYPINENWWSKNQLINQYKSIKMKEIFYNWMASFINWLYILALPWYWPWRKTLFYISTKTENLHRLLSTRLASPFTVIIRTALWKLQVCFANHQVTFNHKVGNVNEA